MTCGGKTKYEKSFKRDEINVIMFPRIHVYTYNDNYFLEKKQKGIYDTRVFTRSFRILKKTLDCRFPRMDYW